MKRSSIVAILFALFFIRCSDVNHAGMINGTYVNQSANEYTKSYDTLVVTSFDSKNKTFVVLSKTGFQKIRNGVVQPKQFKLHKWITVWDERVNVLSEGELGRKFYYDSDKKSLTIQGYEYQKLSK